MKIDTTFLNLQTDYGFKLLFGTPENKHILIRFLNALLGDWLRVDDVVYHNKEVLPESKLGKRIVYDVYCTSVIKDSLMAVGGSRNESDAMAGCVETQHHFIVEMQNVYAPPFEERMVYYASKAISGQGKAGWNYDLDPVIAIAVINFDLGKMSGRLVHDVMLTDRSTGEILTEKLHMFFVSLKQLPKEWSECRTELEQMVFLIKNIQDMKTDSLAYIEGRFAEVFEAARSSHLNESDSIAYSQSLGKLRETQAGFRYAASQARAEGRVEGRVEGVEIVARNLLNQGMDPGFVEKVTGLSKDHISSLIDS